MTARAERLAAAFAARFPGARIVVEDESHRHAGHAGARPEGETHYRVAIVAEEFGAMSRLARSRAAHAVAAAEFAAGLHALSLHLRAPTETD